MDKVEEPDDGQQKTRWEDIVQQHTANLLGLEIGKRPQGIWTSAIRRSRFRKGLLEKGLGLCESTVADFLPFNNRALFSSKMTENSERMKINFYNIPLS